MCTFLVVSLLDILALGKRETCRETSMSQYTLFCSMFSLEKDLAVNGGVWRWWKYSH